MVASIYMVLGRLILLLHAQEHSPVRPSWLTKIFVGGDIISFLVQVMGSGMLSSNFTLVLRLHHTVAPSGPKDW